MRAGNNQPNTADITAHALDALEGVYAEPPRMPVLWYREGVRSAVDRHERPSSWGTHDG